MDVVGRNIVCRHQGAHRVDGRQIESGGHLPLVGALAHQRDIATRTERE